MSSVVFFVVGLIIGIIIMLILVMFFYSMRIYIFEYCPTGPKHCVDDDYYNNPSDALNRGYTVDEILHIENDMLYYNRVPKNKNCTPDSDRSIRIRYPKYCSFINSQGN